MYIGRCIYLSTSLSLSLSIGAQRRARHRAMVSFRYRSQLYVALHSCSFLKLLQILCEIPLILGSILVIFRPLGT